MGVPSPPPAASLPVAPVAPRSQVPGPSPPPHNLLRPNAVITHLWQEYHKDAPSTPYISADPKNHEHSRVVENPDASGNLQAKQRLHLCFLEHAIATIEADIGTSVLFARWEIINAKGDTVKEHPLFSKAHCDNKKSAARLQTGRYGHAR